MSESSVELKQEECPICRDGKLYSGALQKFVTCTLCKGSGTVFTEHQCACSAPVTRLSTDQFLYCGRKECLEDLRKDATDPVPEKDTNPWYMGWDGYED